MLSEELLGILFDSILLCRVVTGFGLIGLGLLLLLISEDRGPKTIAATAVWALVGAWLLSGLVGVY